MLTPEQLAAKMVSRQKVYIVVSYSSESGVVQPRKDGQQAEGIYGSESMISRQET